MFNSAENTCKRIYLLLSQPTGIDAILTTWNQQGGNELAIQNYLGGAIRNYHFTKNSVFPQNPDRFADAYNNLNRYIGQQQVYNAHNSTVDFKIKKENRDNTLIEMKVSRNNETPNELCTRAWGDIDKMYHLNFQRPRDQGSMRRYVVVICLRQDHGAEVRLRCDTLSANGQNWNQGWDLAHFQQGQLNYNGVQVYLGIAAIRVVH